MKTIKRSSTLLDALIRLSFNPFGIKKKMIIYMEIMEFVIVLSIHSWTYQIEGLRFGASVFAQLRLSAKASLL